MLYIGWDVGGWNCDKNGSSRDSIVVLDGDLKLTGTPWRGNLRGRINSSRTAEEWIQALLSACHAPLSDRPESVTLAVDTPLGFSSSFRQLVVHLRPFGDIGASRANPYLFRTTERYLSEHGLSPLSAVKDMIGSQATKGMHVLGKFAPRTAECGVWTNGGGLTVIEAYPASCKASAEIRTLQSRFPSLGHSDKDDALTCALIAYLFQSRREVLTPPPPTVPEGEGWIWLPRDALIPLGDQDKSGDSRT